MSHQENSFDFILPTPLGRVGVRLDGEQLAAIDFLGARALARPPRNAREKRVARRVSRYFEVGGRIDVPVQLQGTPFQQRVWHALQQIPPGQTRTYGQLARRLGTSARAVGNACRANPVPLVVPCHRVVAVNGIGGFAGKTTGPLIERKRWLLQHEGVAQA